MTVSVTATMALAALLLAAVQTWAKPNIVGLAKQCGHGNQDACGELAKIAMEDKEIHNRYAAVSALADQSLLAKIAIENDDDGISRVAVSKVTDQLLLEKIAEGGKDASVRRIAVSKLTDQVPLTKAALQDNDPDVRIVALKNVTDEAVLAKAALEDKDSEVRAVAAGRLTDRTALVRGDAEGRDANVRSSAEAALAHQAPVDQASLARLSSGGVCHVVTNGDNVRCEEPSYSVVAMGQGRNTVIHLIDGKGPNEFGEDFVNKGHNVPITAGRHTVTATFYQIKLGASVWSFLPGGSLTANTTSAAADGNVTFNALTGHFYEVSALIVDKSFWRPIVRDVTDGKHSYIVSDAPVDPTSTH
jgi:hypothetical protein